jgi:hypothetical protein
LHSSKEPSQQIDHHFTKRLRSLVLQPLQKSVLHAMLRVVTVGYWLPPQIKPSKKEIQRQFGAGSGYVFAKSER